MYAVEAHLYWQHLPVPDDPTELYDNLHPSNRPLNVLINQLYSAE